MCVTKNTPTPFERMSRTVRSTDSSNAFVASANRRWASSKRETSFGFSTSPTSGSCSNSSASSHIIAIEKSFGFSWTAGSSRQEMIPHPSAAVRSRSAMANWRSFPPSSSRITSARKSTPSVCEARPASDPGQLSLPFLGRQKREQRAQVRQVQERQPLLVRVPEHESE